MANGTNGPGEGRDLYEGVDVAQALEAMGALEAAGQDFYEDVVRPIYDEAIKARGLDVTTGGRLMGVRTMSFDGRQGVGINFSVVFGEGANVGLAGEIYNIVEAGLIERGSKLCSVGKADDIVFVPADVLQEFVDEPGEVDIESLGGEADPLAAAISGAVRGQLGSVESVDSGEGER